MYSKIHNKFISKALKRIVQVIKKITIRGDHEWVLWLKNESKQISELNEIEFAKSCEAILTSTPILRLIEIELDKFK